MLMMSYLNSSPDYSVMKSLSSTLVSLYPSSSVKSTILIKYNTDYQVIHRRWRNSCINLKVFFFCKKNLKSVTNFFTPYLLLLKIKLKCILMKGCWLTSVGIQGMQEPLCFSFSSTILNLRI